METPEFAVGPADGEADLDGILALQRQNLRGALPLEQALRDGFVTVEHTPAVLAQMHALAPSIVARRGGEVVGYALTMPLACRSFLPVLEPMFALFAGLSYQGRPLLSHALYVMGQICIAESCRGRGLFDALYAAHRAHYATSYELIVTEISVRNGRSLRAHERIGFSTLTRYRDATDDWLIVALALR